MRRRDRACTTWRCFASWAARRMRRRRAVLAGGDDVAFNAAMAPMLMAQPGESMRYFVRHLAEDLPLHRRVGRVVAGDGRSGDGASQPVRTLRGGRPPGRPAWYGRSRVPGARACVRALGRQGAPRWPGGRGGACGGARRRCRPGRRAVVTPGRLAGRRRGAGSPEGARLRPGCGRCPGRQRGTLAGARSATTWALGCSRREPAPVLTIDADQLDGALAAVADFADLKSPFLRRHSTGVASLAVAAAGAAGLSDAEATTLGRAALVHDVGRVGVAERDLGSPGPVQRRAVGAGPAAPLPQRAGAAPLRPPRPVRRPGRTPPRASRRLRLPPRCLGRSARPWRSSAGRRRRLPRHDRGPATPAGAHPGRRGVAAARARSTPAAWSGSRSTPCSTPPGRRAARRGWPVLRDSPSARSRCCA